MQQLHRLASSRPVVDITHYGYSCCNQPRLPPGGVAIVRALFCDPSRAADDCVKSRPLLEHARYIARSGNKELPDQKTQAH
jgi:hypothetical protein